MRPPTLEERVAQLIGEAVRLLATETAFDGCIPLPKAQQFTGYTPKAMARKIEDGIWTEGREYHRRIAQGRKRARIWIDLRGVAEWSRRNG